MAVGSFSAGLSGLNANAVYLSVIGNNLANINTIGFKSSSVTFMDLVSQTVGGSSGESRCRSASASSPARSRRSSARARSRTRARPPTSRSRAAAFRRQRCRGQRVHARRPLHVRQQGDARHAGRLRGAGLHRRSIPRQEQILTTGQPTDITSRPACCGRRVRRRSSARPRTSTPARRPATTAITAVQIYDALGEPHVATMTYTKGAAQARGPTAITVPGAEVTGGTAGTPFSIGSRRAAVRHGRQAVVIHCGGTGDGWRHASGRHHVHDADLDQRRCSIHVSRGTSSTRTTRHRLPASRRPRRPRRRPRTARRQAWSTTSASAPTARSSRRSAPARPSASASSRSPTSTIPRAW